jgi:hypothetical protein
MTAETLQRIKANATDKRRYVKLKLTEGNSGFVCEPHEVAGFKAEDPSLVEVDVYMTPAEYEALPDFVGF